MFCASPPSVPPGKRLTLILPPLFVPTSSANFSMPATMGCPFGFWVANLTARALMSCANTPAPPKAKATAAAVRAARRTRSVLMHVSWSDWFVVKARLPDRFARLSNASRHHSKKRRGLGSSHPRRHSSANRTEAAGSGQQKRRLPPAIPATAWRTGRGARCSAERGACGGRNQVSGDGGRCITGRKARNQSMHERKTKGAFPQRTPHPRHRPPRAAPERGASCRGWGAVNGRRKAPQFFCGADRVTRPPPQPSPAGGGGSLFALDQRNGQSFDHRRRVGPHASP